MTGFTADIVDIYVFRRLNARVQFLLLQRKSDASLGNTWQSFHSQIGSDETALTAGVRSVRELSGLNVSAMFSADYINQFYDDARDVIVLAPVIAVNVSPQSPILLGSDFRDWAWFDRDDATARLPFSGQRWAVRHIDEIMNIGAAESELYRLQVPQRGVDVELADQDDGNNLDSDSEDDPPTVTVTNPEAVLQPDSAPDISTDVRKDEP